MRKIDEDIILCEACVHSVTCSSISPGTCKEFAYSTSTSFNFLEYPNAPFKIPKKQLDELALLQLA